MMADQSDDINDLIKYNSLINEGNYDAILGSRFLRGSNVINYPTQKLILNRVFNYFVGFIFGIITTIIRMLLKFIKKFLKKLHL